VIGYVRVLAGSDAAKRIPSETVGPDEIRALRGALSRAAFARQLAVTPLTVHRWELPDENKEARRPRGRVLERLRRWAATDEAPGASSSPPPISEPPDPEDDEAFDHDEVILLPLLDQSASAQWELAEREIYRLLETRSLSTPAGRALASLGLAFMQFNMRFDMHGARMTWAPIAEDVEAFSRRVTIASSIRRALRATSRAPSRCSATGTTTSASCSCALASRRCATPIHALGSMSAARMPR
jgi:hypothetical protein